MGISAGGSKKGPKSDINITPLVDVVLVLLIIFMVTTPIMMRQITLEVPRKLEAEENPLKAAKQITVLVRVKGDVVISTGISEKSYPAVELTVRLRELLKDRLEKVVFVDFEDEVKYGDVVGAMDSVRGAGASTVALKIRDPSEQKPGGPAPGFAPP